MFGKLMYYEFRYMLRIFVPMWVLFLVLSIINGFTMGVQSTGDYITQLYLSDASWLTFLLLMALILVGSAMAVVALVVIIQRFYRGLLKDEGYLMFTLPVKSGALINAKGLSATILMAITAVVGILGMIILMVGISWGQLDGIGELFSAIGRGIESLGLTPFSLIMVILWGILLAISSVASSLYLIYLALALGHLAKKHRVAWSILAYLGINLLQSAVTTFLASVTNWESVGEILMELVNGMTSAQSIVTVEIVSTVGYLVLTVIYFFVTRYILDHRLNLE